MVSIHDNLKKKTIKHTYCNLVLQAFMAQKVKLKWKMH